MSPHNVTIHGPISIRGFEVRYFKGLRRPWSIYKDGTMVGEYDDLFHMWMVLDWKLQVHEFSALMNLWSQGNPNELPNLLHPSIP